MTAHRRRLNNRQAVKKRKSRQLKINRKRVKR